MPKSVKYDNQKNKLYNNKQNKNKSFMKMKFSRNSILDYYSMDNMVTTFVIIFCRHFLSVYTYVSKTIISSS